MTGYIYLPVPTDQHIEDAEAWRLGQMEKDKVPYDILKSRYLSGPKKGITRFIGDGCLAQVKPEDKIYILLHGTGESDSLTIGTQLPSGKFKAYNPAEMAKILEKEGLTKDISRVNVFACGSGLASSQIPAWAQRLKEQMVHIGFLEVVVGGYTADLYP